MSNGQVSCAFHGDKSMLYNYSSFYADDSIFLLPDLKNPCYAGGMNLLLRYIAEYKKTLLLALGLAVVNQVFSLLDPQIFRMIVDRYASHAGEMARNEFIGGVLLLVFASVGAAFVSRVAKNFQDYFVNYITQRVGTRLYGDSVTHTFSLPYAIFEDQRSGQILLQLQKARTDSQQLITSAINIVFLSIVGILFVLIYAFTVHWSAGLAYFLIIPVLGLSTTVIGKKIKAVQTQVVAQSAELAGSTTETLRNVELVKSLGLEEQETRRLNAVNEQILALELKKIRLIRALSFTQGTLINAMRSGIIFLMMWLIFNHIITVGEFFSLFIYSFFIFSPLGELGTVVSQYNEAKASMEALQAILALKPEKKPAHLVRLEEPLREVTFDRVSFAYAQASEPSLRNVSARIGKGQSVAFVGPSGAGKTTVMKLLVGLYRPTEGRILLNGKDSAGIDYDAIRRRIGYVSQETQLFAGTVRENLMFVNPSATDEDCMEALRAASALVIVERGGRGLDTKIGEGGIKISGGERQRLAIARALLRKPELIMFDEATSSLDSITEKAITGTIRQITSGKRNLMSVFVAHRLSTIAHADRIYVLERGHAVEEGNHSELLRAGGLYAALWREQSAQRDSA